MKTPFLCAPILLAVTFITATSVGRAATANVGYGGTGQFTFRPPVITINQGDTVVWTNAPGGTLNHTVTGPASDPLCGGSVVTMCSWTFTNAGTFLYHCNTHISFGMTGAVNVVASPVPVVPAVLTNMTVLSNGQAQFQVLSTALHTNHIQASTNLATTNWTTISTIVPATNTFTVTDSNAPDFQLRFYRVIQPSP